MEVPRCLPEAGLNVAARTRGERVEWDGPDSKIIHMPGANQFLSRKYRRGLVAGGTAETLVQA